MSSDRPVSAIAVFLGVLLVGLAVLSGIVAALSLYAYVASDDGIGLIRGVVLAVTTWALVVLGASILRAPPSGDPVALLRWRRRRLQAGIVLGMCILPALLLTVVPNHTRSMETHRKTECLNHQRQMATLLSERARSHGWPKHGGKAFVLSLLADGVVSPEETRNLEMFFCPACGMPDFEREMLRAYRGLTPESIDGTHLHSLTAYAGRRNDEAAYRLATGAGSSDEEPVLACLCHPRCALVAFADASVKLLDREELGLGPDDPIVVGEASKSSILRKLSFD